MSYEARLAELGLVLPPAAAPVANYIPFTIQGRTLYVSGQVSRREGALWPLGKLGGGISMQDGVEAAKLCFLAILAQARVAAGGNLDGISRVLRLTGYVASTPDFGDQPLVINGASDLSVAIFGEAGRHARSAVGVAALPGNVAVEIEGIFELRSPQ